ncbi:MAG TPA: hypothetical protein PKY03_03770 [Moraxellaceae bacterium]|jgi:uncharacterized protein|nr:hypothetical protein [Moraxellaceae bacterium]HQX89496.1 hypothetical protein [Moraxellaceae bacterium]
MIYQTKLSAFLRQKFVLDWDGIHGAKHWARVKRLGRYLGAEHGADLEVVTLFALMHDSCREDEDRDIEHGSRASLLVREMNGVLYGINDFQENQLAFACEGHSHGGMSHDITIQVCWDADRLDLGRLAIQPDPRRLGTETAQRLCAERWPYERVGR